MYALFLCNRPPSKLTNNILKFFIYSRRSNMFKLHPILLILGLILFLYSVIAFMLFFSSIPYTNLCSIYNFYMVKKKHNDTIFYVFRLSCSIRKLVNLLTMRFYKHVTYYSVYYLKKVEAPTN
ncbi:hypothetical protein IKA_02002 [Bacillus cereus VD169]|nr:hypothetical protein IKA_02002 [Bacillus cereus VD169]